MNIYCLERSSQGISTLTMDEFLTRAAADDEDDASDASASFREKGSSKAAEGATKPNMEKSTSTRSIVSTSKKTTKTTTKVVNGHKVITTVVVEDATPEELERMIVNNAKDRYDNDDHRNNNDQRESPPLGMERGRRRNSARSVVDGVLQRLSRSLSRGAARRSLSRGSNNRRGSFPRLSIVVPQKDKKNKKKDKTNKKGLGVYLRADGKIVRRVKKKDKNNPMLGDDKEEEVLSPNQDEVQSHHSMQDDLSEKQCLEKAEEEVVTLTSAEAAGVPFIGPEPGPEGSTNTCEMNRNHPMPQTFIGPQPLVGQQQQPRISKQEEEPSPVIMVGPMLPDDWKERATKAAATAKSTPPTQTVLNSVIKAKESQQGSIPAWRLQATAAAKNHRSNVQQPFMVQQSVNLANNPGQVPAWKTRAKAAAAAAKKNCNATTTTATSTPPPPPPTVVQQSIEQAANQGIPTWKPKAKASATAAVAKKWDEKLAAAAGGSGDASSSISITAVPEWKRKLIEKKKQKLQELEQLKAEAVALP